MLQSISSHRTSPPPSPAASFLSPKERFAQIRLALTKGIGPKTFSDYMSHYGSAERCLEALFKRNNLPFKLPTKSEIEDHIAQCKKYKIRHLLRSDPDYPLLLSHIPDKDAPLLLFAKGNISRLSEYSIGVVGARNASLSGLKISELIASGLAQQGCMVVSGLASGIDTAAHKAALRHGMTIAVTPSGFHHPYPSENALLQDEIAEKGCIISETPPYEMIGKHAFPARNRIIAGLCSGTVIIEAASRSGTLITARRAFEYDRDVFAVPGCPLDPRSEGGNSLIREGAILVRSANDILENPFPYREVPLKKAAWCRPRDPDSTSELLQRMPHHENKKEEDLFSTSHCSDSLQDSSVQILAKEQEQKNNSSLGKTSLPSSKREENQPKEPETSLYTRLFTLLSAQPVTVDELSASCQLSPPSIIATLGQWEVEGIIEQIPGRGYIRKASSPNMSGNLEEGK